MSSLFEEFVSLPDNLKPGFRSLLTQQCSTLLSSLSLMKQISKGKLLNLTRLMELSKECSRECAKQGGDDGVGRGGWRQRVNELLWIIDERISGMSYQKEKEIEMVRKEIEMGNRVGPSDINMYMDGTETPSKQPVIDDWQPRTPVDMRVNPKSRRLTGTEDIQFIAAPNKLQEYPQRDPVIITQPQNLEPAPSFRRKPDVVQDPPAVVPTSQPPQANKPAKLQPGVIPPKRKSSDMAEPIFIFPQPLKNKPASDIKTSLIEPFQKSPDPKKQIPKIEIKPAQEEPPKDFQKDSQLPAQPPKETKPAQPENPPNKSTTQPPQATQAPNQPKPEAKKEDSDTSSSEEERRKQKRRQAVEVYTRKQRVEKAPGEKQMFPIKNDNLYFSGFKSSKVEIGDSESCKLSVLQPNNDVYLGGPRGLSFLHFNSDTEAARIRFIQKLGRLHFLIIPDMNLVQIKLRQDGQTFILQQPYSNILFLYNNNLTEIKRLATESEENDCNY